LSEGSTTVSGVLASFTDPGGLEAPGEYLATIDWGDGSGPATVPVDASGGLATGTISGSHTYANEEAAYTITVTVQQLSETTTLPVHTVTDAVTVSDPDISATGGQSIGLWEGPAAGRTVNGVLASFSDPGGLEAPGEYLATIDWGRRQRSGDGAGRCQRRFGHGHDFG
jgi:hypothetical protein